MMKGRLKISGLQMMSISHLIAAMALLPFVIGELPILLSDYTLLSHILGLSLCMLVARILYYYAFSKADVGEVSIFSSLTPTYTLIIAPFFGYTISGAETAGVILISMAVYVFFLQPRRDARTKLHYLFSPFMRITSSWPLFCTFLSTLPPAFAVIFQKEALQSGSPMLISFSMCLIIGVAGFIIMLAWKKAAPHSLVATPNQRWNLWGALLVAGVLQAIMIVAISYLLLQTSPAPMQALIRFAIPLQIILAYIFLHEKKQIRHRLWSTLLAIIGGCLIVGVK